MSYSRVPSVASIDFNDQAVPLPLTITCTDGNTAITGTFNVNIVDEVAESTGFAGTSGDRNGYQRRFADGRHNPPHVQLTSPANPQQPVITLLPSTGTSINDGLQAAAATIHTFNVTDSDDVVTCSTRAPESTLFELASIDFNDPPVSLTLTIKCTDRNVLNDITGTFNVNIVDSPPVFTALPATGTNIFDGLKHATETLHTFSVTDSDDAVNCSARVPENALFEVIAGVASKSSIIDIHINALILTKRKPQKDAWPSPNVSDSTVTQMLLGKFTTTDPDTACSVTSPSTTVYEIRNVTSPVNVSQPEFEVRISSTVTEAAIDFNDQAVPLTLTIRCTDGNPVNVITGTFNVNIVDEVRL
ncbi:hypothetical protein DPMN_020642 [Dreissena polymorpha]|uniref:Uncharacterized protein n=1 Tax=Dreissena polymorpha TaxID=45954 RepID=A0A9D4NJ91_DREPO|nr:hypothetical protein DPMN_020642 [Dreissena polymorpha]